MIVYPAGLLTSASPSLVYPRIGWHKWSDELLLIGNSVAVSNEASFFPKDAPLRPDTAESWAPVTMPASWQLDLGANRTVEYIGIAAHTLGESVTTVLAETSTDQTTWTTFGVSHLPTTNFPILFLDASRSTRYVRLSFTGGIVPKIAVINIGKILAVPYFLSAGGFTPMSLSRVTELTQTLSRSGQLLGQRYKRKGLMGSATFQYMDPDWYRTNFDPFVDYARSKPFFFAWYPSKYTNECSYVWCPADIKPSYMGLRDLMKVQLDMQGHAR